MTTPDAEASRARITPRQIAVALLATVLLVLGLYTLHHFIAALVWAGIFAIALWPLYRRTVRRFPPGRHDVLWPTVFTLAVACLFIVPVVLLGFELAREAHAVTGWIEQSRKTGISVPDALGKLPYGRDQAARWWRDNLGQPDAARATLEHLTQGRLSGIGRRIGQTVAHSLTEFFFTLLALFFLFREGHDLTQQLRRAAARAFGSRGQRIGGRIIDSVHGTVDGLVLVGLGEGVALGVIYAVAGVPHPALFGAVSAVAAMIPFAAGVAICAAALLLFATGGTIAAAAVLVAGFVVTFAADHFVRPTLIGGQTKLPFLWVLLGILGGVESWGLIGLFVGPALMATLMMLWREWTAPSPSPTAAPL